ncbi:SDR family oxidoreductase [Zavarzinia compransoris]|uniref:NmrA-like domain-containing protein n=1 Tax=Zavarzinia compransoris TaxID=1264899 RepID=A0A317E124_9PROT|nr:NmrA family NAD(P)-binding protein [Zavarzinia compransoris]PWR18855.1 hypothetical protein DKG75_17935 [Zavarzinia compransoris]TDP48848.1 uncharacterized protein YbjT (DUF2867 family) [Zavarzinia compransoris]
MRILVAGGTGKVGREVVAGLNALGLAPRLLLRPGRPPVPGTETARGDLFDAPSLAAACAGVDRLFLVTPLDPEETAAGLNAVAAARAAGVRRIVFLGIHNIEAGRHIPHFATKLPVLAALREAGPGWTVIEPNNFFQNDIDLFGAIGAGVYPQPLGALGLSRVDTRDIAAAAVRALLEDGFAGRCLPLVGPEVLNGAAVAARYQAALGRPVAYAGDDLTRWNEAVRPLLPGWLRHDLSLMYGYFQARGLAASDQDLAATRAVLGRPPRDLAGFIAGQQASGALAEALERPVAAQA